MDICHNKATNILDGRIKQVYNSKETSVSMMFVNVPSAIMTEMLSLHEFLITLMLSKTKIEFSTENPSRVDIKFLLTSPISSSL